VDGFSQTLTELRGWVMSAGDEWAGASQVKDLTGFRDTFPDTHPSPRIGYDGNSSS